MSAELRGKFVIAGIGELQPSTKLDGKTAIELIAEVTREALLDATIPKEEIDGLLVPEMSWNPLYLPLVVAEFLNIEPTYAGTVNLGGASCAGMVWRAAAAIAAGMCRNVLCIAAGTEDPKSFYQHQLGRNPPGLAVREFETPYGPMGANSGYALMAQRHIYEYGTTARQLAKIAVDQRINACANPQALFYDKPIAIEDVLNSPVIVNPIHLLEIVKPCNGATAFIVASAEQALVCPHIPVYVLGYGEKVAHHMISASRSLTTSPVTYTARKAFEMARVTPQDIDLASVYDCYTITVLITLEDAGFCEKGKGGPFVEEHDLSYKGDFPLNTHGGQLSFGQAGVSGGASHIVEAVRQLRGEAGERQLSNCELVFVNGNGGVMGAEVSLVLGV